MQSKPTRARLRLATTYLAIIMVMSIGFSVIFYSTTARQLEKHRPELRGPMMAANSTMSDLDDYLDTRAAVGKRELIAQLLVVNLMALVVGAILSYLLAEQTLKPIEENMESQAQFVSDASHELRTPLTSMKVSNEVALRNNNLNIKEARSVLEGNVDDINRLEHLTAALLNLSKNDPIIIEPMVDVRTCIATALTTVAPRAVERNISIDDKTKDVYLQANQQALVQIIAILLDNAVKYSHENQSITISTSSTTKTVSIVITDHGIGMDANTIEHIYTRFYRADKARTFAGNAGGYGLGLPIAKKLAVAMKGSITASSTPGKGTKMIVTLPRARAK